MVIKSRKGKVEGRKKSLLKFLANCGEDREQFRSFFLKVLRAVTGTDTGLHSQLAPIEVAERKNCRARTSDARFRGRASANLMAASEKHFVRCSKSFFTCFLLSNFYFVILSGGISLP